MKAMFCLLYCCGCFFAFGFCFTAPKEVSTIKNLENSNFDFSKYSLIRNNFGTRWIQKIELIHAVSLITSPEVIILFSCSTQLCIRLIMLINVKMQTIVGILTFISMINTASESLKARWFFLFFSILVFCEQLKFMLN